MRPDQRLVLLPQKFTGVGSSMWGLVCYFSCCVSSRRFLDENCVEKMSRSCRETLEKLIQSITLSTKPEKLSRKRRETVEKLSRSIPHIFREGFLDPVLRLLET